MLIILEGNECCFKSTVAKKVSEVLKIPVIKGSSFELSTVSNEQLFKNFINQAKLDNVCIDRSIYSNQTYATIYNDFTILTDEQRQYIENMIKDKAVVYYLFADDDVIKDRIRERGDDYVELEMISEINKLFAKNISKSPLKVVYYDTSEWTSDEIAQEIINDYKHKTKNKLM